MWEKIFQEERVLALSEVLHENASIVIEGLWNSPKALIASLIQKVTGNHILILTGASQEQLRLYHDFAVFTDRPVVDYPAWETLPQENVSPSPDIVGERYRILSRLVENTTPHIILSGLQACLQRVLTPKQFKQVYLPLKVGESYPFDALVEELSTLGYRRQPAVTDKGEFAVRGGIIDIFSVSNPEPYRLEFWGDEITSIRAFDPIGQKSVRMVHNIDITPAQERELLNQKESLGTILDYLGPKTTVIFDDLLSLEDRYVSLVNLGAKGSHSFCDMDDFLDSLKNYQKIFWCQQPLEELSEVHVHEKNRGGYYSGTIHTVSFQIFKRDFTAKQWRHPFVPLHELLTPEESEEETVTGQELLQGISKYASTDMHVHFLCATEPEESALREKIALNHVSLPKHTSFHLGYLSSGFAVPNIQEIVFPYTEISQRYKIRRQQHRTTYHISQPEVYALAPGDIVVHMHHGIGRYLGLEKRVNNQGVETEFLTLEYSDGAKLYVPLTQSHLVSKYIGSNEEVPKFHVLGGGRWQRTKELSEKAIVGYAKDLLELYAMRSVNKGFVYPEDGPDMHAFEEEFPFVETEDQLRAISEVKEDMVSPHTMDRLICGDAGYGKTEVAMRAAFKAVVEGQKQVAVLVPTTVLAMQHYENFVERMGSFPINIAFLSRLRTAKQTRETLQNIAEGNVDIIVGTHRIISGDVIFKNLGMVIIDEEQRFGVAAKEYLKKIKNDVDCLTLSATPIPRTLYMSLVGARDMSLINTPPQDRLPITTLITEPNEIVIKTALLRELSRDGQTFVIHNRVETIYDCSSRLQKLLPQARIVVAHGQMDAEESESAFHAFKSGRADVLVATTIIENGIDIPNANTIIVEHAERFGMADLYQLRGRVGRWNRRAYAYFLVHRLHTMPEIARKRIEAIAGSSGYGAGMKVALRDLEIRGAGNILGTEQSGHVAAIGFHLYCKLLKRTITSMQGKAPPELCDTKLDFSIDARLPEDYVNDPGLRMEIYHRLGEALSWEEVDAIWDEIKDRFGPPPPPAEWLYHFTRVRVFAARHGITHLKIEKFTLLAERQKKQQQLNFSMPKTPEELENRVITALKEAFNLK